MKINDSWQYEDIFFGLKLQIVKGEKLNRLCIGGIMPEEEEIEYREYIFDQEGNFMGAESKIRK